MNKRKLFIFSTFIVVFFSCFQVIAQSRNNKKAALDPVEEAIDAGLTYLYTVQRDDGSYPEKFGDNGAISALAGMAFLAKGYTPDDGLYGESIVKSVEYILKIASEEGYFGTVHNDNGQMYVHSICTLFLSEVSGMVNPELQEKLDELLPKAIKILLDAQNVRKDDWHKGGWRYRPNSTDSDMSCSGWALMALRSCRLNGGRVPSNAIDRAVEYVRRHQHREQGFFMYQNGDNSRAVTLSGAGILCLELCGRHNDPASLNATRYLLRHYDSLRNQEFKFYGIYYTAQGLFQIGGDAWRIYYDWMRTTLVPWQQRNGSWKGHGNEDSGPYSTSLMVLAFTVPYRQLPIYQRDETVDED
ncbi:MAG: terpene cyclase/mutase family protein [Lentisphaerae bacterium]|nr:terpene cyclase/mutase family protein [Lentisphaerota bacterium]